MTCWDCFVLGIDEKEIDEHFSVLKQNNFKAIWQKDKRACFKKYWWISITSNKENKSIRLINASKRSAIAEHLLITLIEQVIITWKDFKLLKIVLILLI